MQQDEMIASVSTREFDYVYDYSLSGYRARRRMMIRASDMPRYARQFIAGRGAHAMSATALTLDAQYSSFMAE